MKKKTTTASRPATGHKLNADTNNLVLFIVAFIVIVAACSSCASKKYGCHQTKGMSGYGKG